MAVWLFLKAPSARPEALDKESAENDGVSRTMAAATSACCNCRGSTKFVAHTLLHSSCRNFYSITITTMSRIKIILLFALISSSHGSPLDNEDWRFEGSKGHGQGHTEDVEAATDPSCDQKELRLGDVMVSLRAMLTVVKWFTEGKSEQFIKNRFTWYSRQNLEKIKGHLEVACKSDWGGFLTWLRRANPILHLFDLILGGAPLVW